jgi:hypothetical protein
MINVDLKKLDKERRDSGYSFADLGIHLNMQPTTLFYFFKRAEQLKKDLKLIDRLCATFDIDWRTIIK